MADTLELKPVQKTVFFVTWKDSKIPPYVILPRGRRVKVDYMRDGRIMFDSGDVGKYVVELDNKETGEKRIRVEMDK